MFQERLYQMRRERGLSQEELANQVGVSRQAVQKWESGTSQPTLEKLTALARYFGVTLDWLVNGEEPSPAGQGSTIINHYHYEEKGWCFEHKSKCTLFGLPLVHVKVQSNRLCWARGVIAVGNVATGLVAVGGFFSGGLVSIGGFSLGLLSIGGICAGLAAIGGIAAGLLAWGGLAFGLISLGGVAVGQFAYGGVAVGGKLAIGRAAAGPVAVGEAVDGAKAFLSSTADPAAVEAAVREACAGMPRWFADQMVRLAGG